MSTTLAEERFEEDTFREKKKGKLSHDGNPISVLLVVTNAESDCWKWPLKTTEEEADCEPLTMVSAKKKKKRK